MEATESGSVLFDGTLLVDGCEVEFAGNCLHIEPGMGFDAYAELVSNLVKNDTQSRFRIGDAINYGEEEYGENFYQIYDHTDYEEGTLRNYAWVARKIPPSQRFAGLAWSYFVELASVKNQEERLAMMEEIADGDITSVQQLKDRKNADSGKTEHIESVVCEACFGAGRLMPEEAEQVNALMRQMRE